MRSFQLLLMMLFACFTAVSQITIDECQRQARENYPLIKKYDLVRQSADFSVSNAAKAYLPQVSLGAQATYQSDVPSFPEQMTQIYQQMGVNMAGLNKDQYKIALEINQVIWDGGMTKAQKDIARAEGSVSTQNVETEMYQIRERINQLFFGILALREQLAQNTLLKDLLQSNYENVTSLVHNGVALESDLDMVKAEQLTASQQRTQIESAITAYCQMLSVMTGMKIAETETFEKPGIHLLNSEISGLENARPELQLLEAQAQQFEAQKKAVNATTMPRLGLFAQGFYGYPGLNMFEDMMRDKWSWNYLAGVSLQWNFGSFYTRKGNLKKLQLAQQQVETQRDVFLFNNQLQQLQQQNEIEKMRKLTADDEEIIKLRTAIRQSSEAKYANGTMTINELLRDITAENQASLTKSIHEIERIRQIYELKNTVNQ
ncbi:MAG: TolC family protein [Tannerella sp.]|nr:TolC family protein [Tannerella sp.]